MSPVSRFGNRLEEKVYAALVDRNWPSPYQPTSPVTFRVELQSEDRASEFLGRVGVEVIGPRTVVSTAENFWQSWDQFWYRR